MKSLNKKIKGFPRYKQTKMRVVNYIGDENDSTKYEQMKMRDVAKTKMKPQDRETKMIPQPNQTKMRKI